MFNFCVRHMRMHITYVASHKLIYNPILFVAGCVFQR